MKNFVLIGTAGFIAPKHLKAIKDTGNNLIAALDKNDSVGVLDSYFPECDFFVEFERFERHCEKLKRNGIKIDFVSVCSPNYLHDAHIRFGLRLGADVICEKPVVLNPWNVDALMEIEQETGRCVFNVLQLRLHKHILELKNGFDKQKQYDINIEYITPRGNWYDISWKGDKSKSGGITSNIGVHFFDLLIWIFGDVKSYEVKENSPKTMRGTMQFENAKVQWLLSIDKKMLRDESAKAERKFEVNRKTIHLDENFGDLHLELYNQILRGNGIRLYETKKTIEFLSKIR